MTSTSNIDVSGVERANGPEVILDDAFADIRPEDITDNQLRDGARKFEMFWLQPSKHDQERVIIRFQINSKFSGWKLKDELVYSLGLKVGDTINAEVNVAYGPQLIDDADDVDLFAEGDAASWLINKAIDAGGPENCLIDGVVKFNYERAPIGGIGGKPIWKASLILIRGIACQKVPAHHGEFPLSPEDTGFFSIPEDELLLDH